MGSRAGFVELRLALKLRESLALTQEMLAEALGITRDLSSRLELSGRASSSQIGTLVTGVQQKLEEMEALARALWGGIALTTIIMAGEGDDPGEDDDDDDMCGSHTR